MDEEGLKKTAHEKIFIGKPIALNYEEFMKQLAALKLEAYKDGDGIRKPVAEIVKTYRY